MNMLPGEIYPTRGLNRRPEFADWIVAGRSLAQQEYNCSFAEKKKHHRSMQL